MNGINSQNHIEVNKQKGDLIRFEVADEYGNRLDGRSYIKHSLHDKLYEITYVLSGWGIEKDYVVLAIKQKEKENE